MLKELKPAVLMMVVLTILTGLIYPAVMTAISQAVFPDQANGSLIVSNGQVVGSSLIGQNFTKPEHFHSRPSAAGSGYDPTATAGSNLGPTSAKLINGIVSADESGKESVGYDGIKLRVVHYCVDNGIPYESSVPLDAFTNEGGELDDVRLIKAFSDDKAPLIVRATTPIPADAVTASASGLDPHISPRNAELQAGRIAKARHIPLEQVRTLVAAHTEGRTFGILGESRINVLELNLALDDQFPARSASPETRAEPVVDGTPDPEDQPDSR